MRRRDLLTGSLLGISSLSLGRADAGQIPPTADNAWPTPASFISLWPGVPPGALDKLPVEAVTERSQDQETHDRVVRGVANPRLAVFPPANPNGSALLIVAGGGYSYIAIDREGYEVAARFAAAGVTCFVLIYRLPGEGWKESWNVPLADGQRAMRIIRRDADHYGINREKVACIGFSAGGHLACDLTARFAVPVYQPVDQADALTARPDLSALMYPAQSMLAATAHAGSRNNLLGPSPNPETERTASPYLNLTPQSPPCFLVHAEDDPAVSPDNTLLFRAALRANGGVAQTHLFAEGGHGFGLRRAAGKPCAVWPDLLLAFARSHALFG